jgi:hypothetical protein
MKLIFSTTYDGTIFKTEIPPQTKYIGPLGLLNLLERELGLYKIFKTDKDRIALYRNCLIDNKENTFYSKSIVSDELNVAKQLLVYRDELILSGWKASDQHQTTRLSDLSVVENDFSKTKGYEGVSDRWQNVINSLSEDKIKEFHGLSISIVDDKNELPNYLQTVFHQLESITDYNPDLSYLESTETNLDFFKNQLIKSIYYPNDNSAFVRSFNNFEIDNSLQVLNFKNEQLAVDCLAAYADENTIVVNRENSNFDYSLVSLGKPATGSKQFQANPQIIQIIKLIIPCFSNDLNLQTLISFLTLSYSPIETSLSKKLAKHLAKKPGVNNEEWNIILNSYTGVNIENEELTSEEEKLLESFKTRSATDEILKDRKKQVDLFLTFNTPEEKGVKKGKKILRFLKDWAKGKGKSQSLVELKEQFTYIVQLCDDIIENFDFENESSLKLEDMIKNFYESKNFTNYFKQEHSIDVIDDVSLIAKPTDKEVFWLDFNSENIIKSNQFLLKEEIDFLSQIKSYNAPEKKINLQLKQWLNGIINCNNKLVLCIIDDTEKEKHPLFIRLESLFGDSVSHINQIIDTPDAFSKFFQLQESLMISNKIALPLAQPYLEVDALKDIEKRNTESASSIEKFIEYPFDWVMQYVAKFSNNVGFDLPGENLLKGNVAHKTIELLIKAKPTLDFKETDIDGVFMSVIKAEAAIFLQPEKRFELSEFKYRFFKAFKNLIQIIDLNKFTVEGLEYEFGKETPCVIDELLGNVTGYIDLLVKDSEGNPFIIDLKWGYSDKKYVKKIENNEAVQLAIYTAAIKERTLSNTGYFMLNQNRFITAAKNLKGNNIFVIDSIVDNQEVLDKIKKSLEFRWSEIKRGTLEIGDNVSLAGLDYYNEKGVISLLEDKNVKKENPYSGYKLFKGLLK